MMTLNTVKRLQRIYGVADTQKRILDGSIWKFEGSMGRFAMDLLKRGVCYLGDEFTTDYYGNQIPSRHVIKKGTMGSKELAVRFWSKVEDGDLYAIEYLDECFANS